MDPFMDYNLDEYVEVNSSLIVGVGVKGNYLVVAFKKGTVYRYPDCAVYFADLTSAESVGKFFHQNIRNQQYEKLTNIWPDED